MPLVFDKSCTLEWTWLIFVSRANVAYVVMYSCVDAKLLDLTPTNFPVNLVLNIL